MKKKKIKTWKYVKERKKERKKKRKTHKVMSTNASQRRGLLSTGYQSFRNLISLIK